MSATRRLTDEPDDLDVAARLLRAGELVAIPTETVYGLAVRADDADAVGRLFTAKGRPSDNPLIVHVATVDDVTRVAREVTPLARRLLEGLAPGPLTVVLPARDDLPRAVTGGLDTVAVRIPDHPVALELLARAGVPLAAPSANRSGRPSPTSADHVLEDLDGRIAAVVDAGPTRIGIESTVVDARGPTWTILRAGGIGPDQLAALAGAPDEQDASGTRASGADGPVASPGLRHRHYAPALPVHVAAVGDGPTLAARLAQTTPGRVGVVAVRADGRLDVGPACCALGVPVDVDALASTLFGLLRRAEELGLAQLVVEAVPEASVGRAVMDRVRRAAEASGGTIA